MMMTKSSFVMVSNSSDENDDLQLIIQLLYSVSTQPISHPGISMNIDSFWHQDAYCDVIMSSFDTRMCIVMSSWCYHLIPGCALWCHHFIVMSQWYLYTNYVNKCFSHMFRLIVTHLRPYIWQWWSQHIRRSN